MVKPNIMGKEERLAYYDFLRKERVEAAEAARLEYEAKPPAEQKAIITARFTLQRERLLKQIEVLQFRLAEVDQLIYEATLK